MNIPYTVIVWILFIVCGDQEVEGCAGVSVANSCYTLTATAQSFYLSIYQCSQVNGRVGFIDTQEKDTAIRAFLKTNVATFGEYVWTGGFTMTTSPTSMSDFVWMCGNDYSKSPALSSGYTGHVNGGTPSSTCMTYQINTGSSIEEITYLNCGTPAYALCEVPGTVDVCDANYGTTTTDSGATTASAAATTTTTGPTTSTTTTLATTSTTSTTTTPTTTTSTTTTTTPTTTTTTTPTTTTTTTPTTTTTTTPTTTTSTTTPTTTSTTTPTTTSTTTPTTTTTSTTTTTTPITTTSTTQSTTTTMPCSGGVVVNDEYCYRVAPNTVDVAFFGETECSSSSYGRLAFVDTKVKHDAIVAMLQANPSYASATVLVSAFMQRTSPVGNFTDFDWFCVSNNTRVYPVAGAYTGHMAGMSGFECAAYDVASSLIKASNCIGTMYVLCETAYTDFCTMTTTTTTSTTSTTPTTTSTTPPTTTSTTTTTPSTTSTTTSTSTTATTTTTTMPCSGGVVVNDEYCFTVAPATVGVAFFGDTECSTHSLGRLAFVDTQVKHDAVVAMLQGSSTYNESTVLVSAFMQRTSPTGNYSDFDWYCLSNGTRIFPVISGYTSHMSGMNGYECAAYNVSSGLITATNCIQTMYVLCETAYTDFCVMSTTTTTTPTTVTTVPTTTTMPCSGGVVVNDEYCYRVAPATVNVAFFGETECKNYSLGRLAFVDTQVKHDAIVSMLRANPAYTSTPVLVSAFMQRLTPIGNASDFDWLCMENTTRVFPVTGSYVGHLGNMAGFDCATYNATTGLISATNCISSMYVLCETAYTDFCTMPTTATTSTSTTTTSVATTVSTTTAMPCAGGVTVDNQYCYRLIPSTISVAFFGETECKNHSLGHLAFVDTQAKHDAIVAFLQAEPMVTNGTVLVSAFMQRLTPVGNASDFDWLCVANLNQVIPVAGAYTGHLGAMNGFDCAAYNVSEGKIAATNCIQELYVLCETETNVDFCDMTTTSTTSTSTTTPSPTSTTVPITTSTTVATTPPPTTPTPTMQMPTVPPTTPEPPKPTTRITQNDQSRSYVARFSNVLLLLIPLVATLQS